MSYILSVWHVRLDACRFKFERRKKEITFFIVYNSLSEMAGDLKSRPFCPIGPSHFHVAWEGFYRLFSFRSHLCPSICGAVLLAFQTWCVLPFRLLFEVEKIYSPKIVFTMYLALAERCRPLVATVLLEHWFWWVLFNTKNTQEVMTSLSNEAEYK